MDRETIGTYVTSKCFACGVFTFSIADEKYCFKCDPCGDIEDRVAEYEGSERNRKEWLKKSDNSSVWNVGVDPASKTFGELTHVSVKR